MKSVRARLAAREDSEHEQAIVRLVIGVLIVLYFSVHFLVGARESARTALTSYTLPFMFLSAIVFAHIVARPAVNPTRRILAAILDMTTLTIALSVSGRFAAVLVFIYAWVILGNGARYGVRYMWFSCALATAGFGWVVSWNDYWRLVPELAFTVGACLVIVPAYASILIGRNARTNVKLQQQAALMASMATRDSLTELPNRALFFDRLAQAASLAKREGKQIALLYVDLDGFKLVNDQHGHHIGDQLLVAFARRVLPKLRNYDTLARIGGDEFVILLNQLTFPTGVARVASTVLGEIESIRDVDGIPLQVSASIGIACWPMSEQEVSPQDALRRADAAMYEAKRAGKGRWMMDASLPLAESLKSGQATSSRSRS